MSSYEKLKDAKIDDMMENYLELEKIIHTLPDKISLPLKELLDKLFTQVGILPEKLNESLTAIAAAVQDAEQTTIQLQASSKEAIAAATKEAVSDAQIQVGVSIGGAVKKALNDSLHATQSKLDALQQRADKLGGQFIDERARKYNFILTGGLAVSITLFICLSAVGMYRYEAQIKGLKSDLDYSNKLVSTGLQAIPKKYQDQFFAAEEAANKK